MIDYQLIIEIKNHFENELSLSFPSDEIEKLENLLGEIHPEIEDFIMDFNAYCDLIAGSCTYVIRGKQVETSKQVLERRFFSELPSICILAARSTSIPGTNEGNAAF